jgi:hypothetical protein
MGIFKRHRGHVSQPEGDGPVTLAGRTEPGGEGSPDTNQGRTEPMSPTPDHPEVLAVPEPSDMSPGAADPQTPSHPDAAALSPAGSYAGGAVGDQPTGLGGPGQTPDATRPGIDPSTSTGRAHGPVHPVETGSGTAHRVPGLQGTAPEGESVESDTEAGATRMGDLPPDAVPGEVSGHGDTGPAPATGDAAAPGTSETQPVVEGVRLPES